MLQITLPVAAVATCSGAVNSHDPVWPRERNTVNRAADRERGDISLSEAVWVVQAPCACRGLWALRVEHVMCDCYVAWAFNTEGKSPTLSGHKV